MLRLAHPLLSLIPPLALLLAPALASAVSLHPGDVLVADSGAGAVVHVAPGSGVQTVVTSGLEDPRDLTVTPGGDLLVTAGDSIVRVNPETGAQSTLSSGGSFVRPDGIVFGPSGDAIVSDPGRQGVLRVDATTGAQSIIALGASGDLDVDEDGGLFLTDGGISRLDPKAGARSTIYTGPVRLDRIAFAADGRLFGEGIVGTGPGAEGVVARLNLDPVSETTVLFTSGFDLTADGKGNLLLARHSGELRRYDPDTGTGTLLASGGSLERPSGLAVVPVPEPSTAALLALALGACALGRRDGLS